VRAPKSAYEKILEELPARIMEVSGGFLKIQASPDVVSPNQNLEAVAHGGINMGVLLGPHYQREMPIVNIGSLPWIFREIEQYEKALNSFLNDDFNKILKQKYRTLILVSGAFASPVIFSRQPIKSLSDLRGLKIRTAGYEVTKIVEELGGQPVNMSAAEAFLSLQEGVVEAAFTIPSNGYDIGYYEVAKYAYDWNFGNLTPWFIIANEKDWESIPAELREKVASEFKKIQSDGFLLTVKERQKTFDLLKGKGVAITQPSEDDISMIKARELLNPIFEDWVRRNEQSGIEKLGISAKSVLAQVLETTGTGGGGDPCYYPTCKCNGGPCKVECCKK
jgi:TRAP-type C4-dicarboxylate transport system substrate-binding protein